MAECRSCGASITWATSDATGKMMPVDVLPVDNGNVELHKESDGMHARVYGSPPIIDVGPLRLSHFASCKQADAWRRK